MKMYQKALFGGALMAAGMTANAQSFLIADDGQLNDAYGVPQTYPSFAYSLNSDTGNYDIAYAAGGAIADTSLSDAGLDLSTSVSSNELRVDGEWDGNTAYGSRGFGTAVIQAFFQVDQAAPLELEWDTSSTDGFVSSFILTAPDGSVLLDFDGFVDPATGLESVNLSPGVDYTAILSFSNGFPAFFTVPNEPSFISATLIPSPGAAGLLGLAGLAAVRRRRA
jgi:hypothetical protein